MVSKTCNLDVQYVTKIDFITFALILKPGLTLSQLK